MGKKITIVYILGAYLVRYGWDDEPHYKVFKTPEGVCAFVERTAALGNYAWLNVKGDHNRRDIEKAWKKGKLK